MSSFSSSLGASHGVQNTPPQGDPMHHTSAGQSYVPGYTRPLYSKAFASDTSVFFPWSAGTSPYVQNNTTRGKGKLLSILFTHIILFALLLVVTGKIFFTLWNPSIFLYLYGIAVTSVLLVTMFFARFIYRDPYKEAVKRRAGRPRKNIYVSLMVAVHNEERIIDRCIQSQLAQTYPYREIIFVNDASTDNTRAHLDHFASLGLIRVIHLSENVGKKRALGVAMSYARGSIFLFSDSDSVLAPDAADKSVEIMAANPEVGAISGHCRALNGDRNLITKVQDSWYEGQFSIRKAFESVFGAVSCVSGPAAIFRREAIYNYIPAWENDSFLGQEFKFSTDRTLTGFVLGSLQIDKKLKQKYANSPFVGQVDYPARRWKIVYSKSLRSLTEVPDSFARVFKQQVRWKKSFIRNMFFTGTFYWRQHFLPSFFYYLHVLFVLIGPFIVIRHLIYLPVHGNIHSAVLYLAGIFFVGLMFSFALKIEEKESSLWVYRPFMSIFSTIFLSSLIFYSALTIRNSVWHRG